MHTPTGININAIVRSNNPNIPLRVFIYDPAIIITTTPISIDTSTDNIEYFAIHPHVRPIILFLIYLGEYKIITDSLNLNNSHYYKYIHPV